ncbi:MAG: DNA gyrase subunit A, partial [bacterium]|nr:DNA gyrase subunit A [bacterium]
EMIRGVLYPYGHATLWETGLRNYFQNNSELVRQEVNKNHKIIKVEFLKETEDVYDLTIEGSHNFALAAGIFVHNSVDGDNAAAMRYTEAKLSKIASELLTDIEKETVDWQPNYDNSREEPKVLPAKLPNLLINGSVGIAVGMATNIPPHNLTEVINATLTLIEKPKSSVSDLFEFIKGPDFPTGGIIYDKRAVEEAYATGRGAITTRGLVEVSERKNGSPRSRSSEAGQYDIVISEIPYQVNRAELIIKIAELVQEKKIEGIRDVRDESDKETRIVIELKNEVPPQKILNQLYKHTDLQKDFHLNMTALAALEGGLQPQLMSLKDVLQYYISHREEVVRRRAEFDLMKARERAHILEGLVKALSVIDKIIATIKKSADKEEAHINLVKVFKFSDVQATAILEMRLQALAALERAKLEAELKEKRRLIKELELLLHSPEKITGVIKTELLGLKEKFGDERRTKVVLGGLKEFKEEDLVPKEAAVITFSQSGYIKRGSPDMFKSQKRGGKGLIGSDVDGEDFITHFLNANTHDNILFFTDSGKAFQTKVYEIPVASRTSKGKAVHNFLEIPTTENVSAIVSYPVKNDKVVGEDDFLVLVTKNGVIKKTSLDDFLNVRRSGIIALTLKKDDLLKWANLSSGNDEIIIATANGQAIRFKEKDCRPMGRTASGVTAIRLKKGDIVSGMEIVGSEITKSKEAQLLTVMALGYAKRTPLAQYKIQRRGGSGIKTAKITGKTGPIVAAKAILDQEQLLALSAKGQIIKTEIKTIRIAGRATQGVRIMSLKSGDKLAGIVCL